jgi:CheY-like chemotaxis protein
MKLSTQQPDLNGRRVLVVEDNYVLAESMRWTLEGYGSEVVGPAPNSARALELLESGELDGAILDIDLQGKSSAPIADRLRAAGVPFLFLTGYDGGVLLPRHLHDVVCLSKPVDPDTLAWALHEAMGPTGEPSQDTQN